MMLFKNTRVLFLLVIVIAETAACTVKKVSKKEMVDFVNKSATLNQTEEVNNIKIQVKYIPSQLIVLQELETASEKGTVKINELDKKYNRQYYFRVSFSKNNREVIRELGGSDRYSDLLRIFSFNLGNYINGSTEKKRVIALADYAFEQDFGMSTANSVLLVFRKSDFVDAENIYINIGEFGLGTGSLNFTFRHSELQKIPVLDYTNLQ